jgi:hypothetical protein
MRRCFVLALLLAVLTASLGCDGTHEKGKRKDLDMPKPAENKEKEK